MNDVESLIHPMKIINHVVACRIIAMNIDFLMKLCLQKYVD